MVKEKVLALIVDYLEERGILPQDRDELLKYRYLEVGHIDSFSMIQLIMVLEDEFGIELNNENLENLELINTVGGLAELVEMRIKEKS